MIQVNLAGVAVAAASAMVLGSLWYGPLLGKEWMKLVGISKDDVKKSEMPKLYGIMFVGAILEAYVLSMFIHYAGAVGLVNGAKTGLWAWLGFVGPVMLANYMFAKKPLKLYKIDAGYALVNLLVMGAIIASMF